MPKIINFDQEEFNERKEALNYWYATGEELIAAYENGDRNFAYLNIKDADLQNADLSESDFSAAVFDNVNLELANLSKSNMEGAEIKNSQLYSSDFNGIYGDVGFNSCNLKLANFSGAELQYSFFEICDLSDASFIKANFESTSFNSVNMSGASCNQTDFQNASFENVIFNNAYLIGTNFRYAQFENVSLLKTALSDVSLNNVNLLDVKGLYSVFSTNLSSRQDSLYGGVTVDGKIQLCLWAGCQGPSSVEELISVVEETHGKSIHARHYKKAIKCIESMFKIDNSLHKWDYLIKLHNKEISQNE